MTVKELMQKTCASVYIIDNKSKCELTPWNIFFEVFKDCIIDNINPISETEIEITLKTQLVKKEG